MKKIVYFIGAGFSVPAGLPVISNFLFKAKDQFFQNTNHYAYFEQVFDYIDELSKAKNFTNVDLFNVEEILSIADTHKLLGKGLDKELSFFIKDVIKFYTPPFSPLEMEFIPSKHSIKRLFGKNSVVQMYVNFFANVLHLKLKAKMAAQTKDSLDYSDIEAVIDQENLDYKFISLNYDTLIEDSCRYLNNCFGCKLNIPIAKLHGSVEGEIIPPTWNKQINGEVNKSWRNAAEWLSEANEIRIVGYSLPKTDMYIKHLFSTALLEAKNLQKIEVICLDPTGDVEKRYIDMFTFPNFSFYNGDIAIYLDAFETGGGRHKPFESHFRPMEEVHMEAINRLCT